MPTLTQDQATAIAIPLLLGYLINWALFGALAVQVYIYHISYPKDSLLVKLLVHGLFVLETIQTAVVAADLFKIFGSHYGDAEALMRVQLLWLSAPVLSGISKYIFNLSVAKTDSTTISICNRAIVLRTQNYSHFPQNMDRRDHSSACIGPGSRRNSTRNTAARIGVLEGLIKAFASCIVWHAGSAVCDVVIAIAMTYYLSSTDKSFRASHDRLKRLTRLIIETGTLTAAVAIVDLVLFLVIPNSTYHVTPALTLAKLSSNSLVMIFNSRTRTSNGTDQRGGSAFSSSQDDNAEVKFSRRSRLQLRSAQGREEIPVDGIKVRKEMWIDTGDLDIPMENINEGSGTTHKSPGLTEV
ncbi:hypothetical protein BDQ17DRAFT_1429994 [Cyathus striatus]|nr:hypothetical protein BDQ17DRAFT_1429994 [Cyathus striatus]